MDNRNITSIAVNYDNGEIETFSKQGWCVMNE